MTIKVIVELQAKPGKGPELKSLLESVEAKFGTAHPGFLGSTYYEVVDNPNILVETADWTSVEVRQRLGRRLYPLVPTHLWRSCWPRHSERRSSGNCLEGWPASHA